jgi:hypothetical protein
MDGKTEISNRLNQQTNKSLPLKKAGFKNPMVKPNYFKFDQTLDDYLMMPNMLLF